MTEAKNQLSALIDRVRHGETMTSGQRTRSSSPRLSLSPRARPSTLQFVSLDDRLLAAARREGFPTTRPAP